MKNLKPLPKELYPITVLYYMRMNSGKDLHEYIVSTTGTYMSLSTRTHTKILVVDLLLYPTFYLVSYLF